MIQKVLNLQPELLSKWHPLIVEKAHILSVRVANWSPVDQDKVASAIWGSVEAHKGQFRKSGEPYATHPIEVALIAFDLGLDADAICAALLHDAVEDTDVSLEQIEQTYGSAVALMVDGLTKIDAIKVPSAVGIENAATLRKMMLAMSKDMRVIVLKLCDRLHNMMTISSLARLRQQEIALETRLIYAPIASRLGMNQLWHKLMELCFEVERPWRYAVLNRALTAARAHEKNLIDGCILKIKQELVKEGFEAKVMGRSKSVSSVFEKMKEKHLKFKDVLDREAVRIIVEKRSECYLTLGLIHNLWKPIPGFFKDYVALPKINGYQSLHTAVFTENSTPLEIQIRTEQMHLKAEEGFASHWSYKSKEQVSNSQAEQPWTWLQSLLDIQASTPHSDDFLEHVKTDLFSDEVYVFSPTGEVKALPRQATALDFAFSIHSNVGLFAIKVRINGKEQPLGTRLRSGDRIEVQTAKEIAVQPVWLSMCKTGKAKAHIRAQLRTNERGHALEFASDLLNMSLGSLGIDPKSIDQIAWDKALKSLHLTQKEDALMKVVLGSINPLSLAQLLGTKRPGAKGGLEEMPPLLISGEQTEHIKMGSCCAPLPPASIKGVLLPNEGVVVHTADCKKLLAIPQKIPRIALGWQKTAQFQTFTTSIKIRAKNERGALARIAACISAQDADVNNVRVSGNGIAEGRAVIDVDIQVKSKFHLDRVMEALSSQPDVIGVVS